MQHLERNVADLESKLPIQWVVLVLNRQAELIVRSQSNAGDQLIRTAGDRTLPTLHHFPSADDDQFNETLLSPVNDEQAIVQARAPTVQIRFEGFHLIDFVECFRHWIEQTEALVEQNEKLEQIRMPIDVTNLGRTRTHVCTEMVHRCTHNTIVVPRYEYTVRTGLIHQCQPMVFVLLGE